MMKTSYLPGGRPDAPPAVVFGASPWGGGGGGGGPLMVVKVYQRSTRMDTER